MSDNTSAQREKSASAGRRGLSLEEDPCLTVNVNLLNMAVAVLVMPDGVDMRTGVEFMACCQSNER